MSKRALFIPARLSLMKLRVGFLLLGSVLIGALFVLSLLVEQRLADARRDRETMVASRVFDELEREVSAFLEEESERNSYGELANTDPQSWAPFVVGYFKRNQFQVDHVAADGAASENHRRMLWAIAEVATSLDPAEQAGRVPNGGTTIAPREGSRGNLAREAVSPSDRSQTGAIDPFGIQPAPVALPQQQKKEASGSEIIESLNRAPVRRKAPSAPTNKDARQDPFGDYAEKY